MQNKDKIFRFFLLGLFMKRQILSLSVVFFLGLLFVIYGNGNTEAVVLESGKRYPVDMPNFKMDVYSWEHEVLFFAEILNKAYDINMDVAEKYSAWILEAAIYSDNVSPIQLAGVIRTESSFNVDAVSSVGAVGSMQIRPEYWEEYCHDLYDPRENILCGTKILDLQFESYCSEFKTKSESWECALAHYNIGRGNLQRKGWLYAGAKKCYIKKNNTFSAQLIAVSDEYGFLPR